MGTCARVKSPGQKPGERDHTEITARGRPVAHHGCLALSESSEAAHHGSRTGPHQDLPDLHRKYSNTNHKSFFWIRSDIKMIQKQIRNRINMTVDSVKSHTIHKGTIVVKVSPKGLGYNQTAEILFEM